MSDRDIIWLMRVLLLVLQGLLIKIQWIFWTAR